MSEFEKEFATELAKQTAEKLAAPATLPMEAFGEAFAGHVKSWRWVHQGRIKNRLHDAEIDALEESATKALQERLSKIHQDKIQIPPLHIYGPTVQALSYSIGDTSLRDLFLNLLAKSMDSGCINLPLPAYVEILKQISPDEARIINHIASKIRFLQIGDRHSGFLGYQLIGGLIVWAAGQLRISTSGRKTYSVKKNHIVSLEVNLDYPENMSTYLDNLRRLGLIEINYGITVTGKIDHVDKGIYMGYKEGDFYKDIEAQLNDAPKYGDIQSNSEERYIEKGYMSLTEIGLQFIFCTAFPIDGKFNEIFPDSTDTDSAKENPNV